MDISKVVEQLTPIFNSLSEKIGQGGTWMFELYVRQQYVVAVQNFVFAFVGLLLLIPAYFLGKRAYGRFTQKEGYDSYGYDFPTAAVISGGLLLVAGVFIFSGITDGISHLINPQFYALKDLVGTFIPQPSSN